MTQNIENFINEYTEYNIFEKLLKDIDSDWTIQCEDLTDIDYDLDTSDKIIFLHNFGRLEKNAMIMPYFASHMILSLAEAMRMARHVEWLDGALERYHPETIMHIGRICVADTIVHKIRTAWNLKCQGDDYVWKRLLCSDISDIALCFFNSHEKYIGAGLSAEDAVKKSMAMAFNYWFSDSERIKECDHDSLNLIDRMISNQVHLGNKKIEGNAVVCLTLLPGQSISYIDSYLKDDIISNPYYKKIDDVINQAHLMQIVSEMNCYRIGSLSFKDSELASRFALCE